MAWNWLTIATFASIFALLLFSLACVPWGIEFEVESAPNWRGKVELTWAGLAHFHFDIGEVVGRQAHRPAAAARRIARTKNSRRRITQRSRPTITTVLMSVRHGAELLCRLLRQTRVSALDVHCRVGLDDPADTGVLYGSLAPLVAVLRLQQHGSFRIEPDFARDCFEMHGSGRISIVPVRYFLVLASFLLAPRTWRIARAWVPVP